MIKINRMCTIAKQVLFCDMGRITLNLSEQDHLAFKLLALQNDKKLVILLQEAMKEYLEKKGAYDLSIQTNGSQPSDQ